MFQTFDSPANPEQGPGRLALLRGEMARVGVQGFIIPRADVHQGEAGAARDERLQWLMGFTGSAGFCIALLGSAGVFIDGRYRTQVKGQVDLGHFTPVPWPDVKPAEWLRANLEAGDVGYDPWLHSADEIARIEAALEGSGIALQGMANLVDAIWPDQPDAPLGRAFAHPVEFAGESAGSKRARLAEGLRKSGQRSAVITLPDSLCWLLNLRGSDVPRNPVLQGFAVLQDDARVILFAEAGKFDAQTMAFLGDEVTLRPMQEFAPSLARLQGPVRVDKGTAPLAVSQLLTQSGIAFEWGDDPCRLPKAKKNAAELEGMRQAHLRDGAAVVEFLCWLDGAAPQGGMTEISAVQALEGFRRATNALHDISFDTISGAGPNGAIMHYRVSEDSNRALGQNELYLVDSGAQYLDGTTDITRTVAIGDPGDYARTCYTRVLQGVIAISRARWPRGLTGRDLDPLARAALWAAGQDFDHGTGHGVGAFLSVHEGPQRLSRVSEVPIEEGMILSNEPGYYREGEFGIRLENLIVVHKAADLPGGDKRDQLGFETLTFVPFDRRLILSAELSKADRDWLNAYHSASFDKLAPRLSAAARDWAEHACAPI